MYGVMSLHPLPRNTGGGRIQRHSEGQHPAASHHLHRRTVEIPGKRPIILPVAVLQASRKPPAADDAGDISRILRLEVPIIVKLAERKLLLSEVLRLGTGAIVEFLKRSDEPLELLINNKIIGLGETVKVGENFGLRITHIGDVKQLIQALGASKT